jgi:hypothetical protein
MLMVSVTCYLAGAFIDRGVPVRRYALFTGISMLAPACAWALALRSWKKNDLHIGRDLDG